MGRPALSRRRVAQAERADRGRSLTGPGPVTLVAPDLWLFDLDGVLADTARCHARAFLELWKTLGVNGPSYERIAGRRTRDVVEEFTRSLSPTDRQLEDWTRFKQARARECLTTDDVSFPDSAICVKLLQRHGHRLALGTAASRDTATAVLTRQGWMTSFVCIVTGDDVRRGKPAPDIYQAAMKQSAVHPDRTLIIEDSQSGLEAAVASSAYVASVRSGLTSRSDRFVGAFPDLTTLLTAFGVTE